MLPGQAFGLYTHIRNNRIRSGVLIGGLFVLVALIAFAVGLLIEAQLDGGTLRELIRRAAANMVVSLPLAFAATLLWVFIGFRYNVAMINWAAGASLAAPATDPRLRRLIEPLCISRGLTVPRLIVLDSPALNAFATGTNPSQYSITVTSGLLAALDDAELEAVLAHELTHIRNDDVRLMVVAVLIAGVVSFFGEMLARGFRYSSGSRASDRGSGNGAAVLIALGLLVVAWFLAVLIRLALSRSREYLADAGAAELTKNPDALISALKKIAGHADLDGVPSGVMAMCIENDPTEMGDIFSTHPSVAKRIQALRAYAGGMKA